MNVTPLILIVKGKNKEFLCFWAARARPRLLRAHKEERKKGKTRELLSFDGFFLGTRARLFRNGLQRSEKTSATSRGCPREEPTTSIQNGVKKRRGGMRRERERQSAEGVCDLHPFLFFRCRVLTNERKGVARISPPVVLK